MLSTTTPCSEPKHCFYQDWTRGERTCRSLNTKDGSAPYEPGTCPFYKKAEKSYSGDYSGTPYSPEMLEKIEREEIAYRARREERS